MASESETVLAALFANLAIATAKTVAGCSGVGGDARRGGALVADTMNQVFLLVSLFLGGRKPR